ncbi:Arrestin (or s-antigen) n-terminal domain containing protein [Lasiodiplodia theobromae]|uniref:Arrestin-like N-terminal domain-containing protein n=1 Tax=Lasiodiplodia theobromae TaxID=45133 RepID=A0A5N5D4L4_9PEZI|nr:Arrestin (or s-antigen) n-terminal domain containing protein [Lasiodiplodia theobromae]KAB2572362.1 hypothetical protein DBV05_g9005 [Lasiodiplodia theobromae]KAF4541888.1 Arrestin (or s-antigen) n-terminal domain containing protein [Lasiodiplodia theobromae]
MLDISINLKSAGSGLSHELYTTNDEIVGEVVIIATDDIHVDDLDISFIGNTQTRFDNFGAAPVAPHISYTDKRFLHLQQPFEKPPSGMILKAAHPHSFPFNFIVPDRLLPSSCPCLHSDEHLLPPPTMGGAHRWHHGQTTLDDPTPVMAQVAYTITAKVLYNKPGGTHGRRSVQLADFSRPVCVVPDFPESPPIFLQQPSSRDAPPSEYRLRQEKTISNGLFSRGRAGCLVVEAQQPSALKGGLRKKGSPASTTLLLRFDPASDDDSCGPPPQLEDVKRKIQATTVFRAGQMEADPAYGGLVSAAGPHQQQGQQRSYTEAVALPSLCVSGARWVRCGASWAHERLFEEGGGDGIRGLETMVAPSSAYRGGPYYLLKLVIPVEYPPDKALVPSFRSCLVDRMYRLDVTVTLGSFSSVAVRVPIQLCT